ncbi:MAG: hypothetical protein ABL907_23215 [Hyphomicrobium sp.]
MHYEEDYKNQVAFALCINQEKPNRCSMLGPAPFTFIEIVPSGEWSETEADVNFERLPVPHRFSA